LVRSVYAIGPQHMSNVPYGRGRLPAYRFGAPSKGTVVIFGGFDSYVEEFFPMMLAITAAGYQVIGVEGPARAAPLRTAVWRLPSTHLIKSLVADDPAGGGRDVVRVDAGPLE
jgi:hypothetical protein